MCHPQEYRFSSKCRQEYLNIYRDMKQPLNNKIIEEEKDAVKNFEYQFQMAILIIGGIIILLLLAYFILKIRKYFKKNPQNFFKI